MDPTVAEAADTVVTHWTMQNFLAIGGAAVSVITTIVLATWKMAKYLGDINITLRGVVRVVNGHDRRLDNHQRRLVSMGSNENDE